MHIITFHVQPKKEETAKFLEIHLLNGKKERFEFKFESQPLKFADLKNLKLSENEMEALKLLKTYLPQQAQACIYRIPDSASLPVLRTLAATGNLFFQHKNLVCDFFSKAALTVCIEKTGDEIKITGRIKDQIKEYLLDEVDYLSTSSPCWFIKGISLKVLATERTAAFLKRLREQAIHTNDIDLSDEDVAAETAILLEAAQPLPELVLKDRTGAFADLLINYDGRLIPFHEGIKSPNIKRNLKAEEEWEKDLLETGYIRKQVGTSHYYCPMDQIWKSLNFLLEIGWTIKDHKGCRLVPQTKIYLETEQIKEKILVKGRAHFAQFKPSFSTVAGCYNRKEKFIQLSDNYVGLLNAPSNEIIELLNEGEWVSEGLLMHKNKIGTLKSVSEHTANFLFDKATHKLKERLENFTAIEQVLPSPLFLGQLRPYQQDGLNWLQFLYDFKFNGILADDMGLGKTVQILAFISRLPQTLPLLIVVPTSLLFNWKNEINTFLKGWDLAIYHGPKRESIWQNVTPASIILTSYATLRLDLAFFKEHEFQALILDEAQTFKNSESQIFQAIKQVKASFIVSLTGTPLENHLKEIWSHFDILLPGLLGNENEFKSEIAAASADLRYLKRVQKKNTPFHLKKKKEDVAKDLPEKIEQVIYVEMLDGQRELYNAFLTTFKKNLIKKTTQEGAKAHRLEIFEAILRLRQICCHPFLIKNGNEEEKTYGSGKLEALLEDLKIVQAEGNKALIFSQFTGMLKLIAKQLKILEFPFLYLDGATANREKVINEFQQNKDIPFFLISLKAGGVGLNLTAADYVFLYDPWWNEALENQAINRAHRIGQKNNVIAKRYIMAESIEEKMMALKKHKRQLTDELFSEGILDNQLTIEDLLFLIS